MSALAVVGVYGDHQLDYVPEIAPQPVDGVFFEYRSTWDQHKKSRPTWNEYQQKKPIIEEALGLPDVYRIFIKNRKFSDGKLKPDFVPLDVDHVHFLVKINAEIQLGVPFASREEYFDWWLGNSPAVRDYYAKQMTSACTHYRSHTNGFGLDNCHNPLTGERADKDFAKFQMLTTGRFRGKAILENGAPMQRNISPSGSCIAFEAINAQGNYWQYSPLKQWWLFDQPMSTAREIGKNAGGLYLIRDDKHELYPQFGQKLVFPFWLPVDDVAWLPVNEIVRTSLTGRGKRLTV